MQKYRKNMMCNCKLQASSGLGPCRLTIQINRPRLI